MKRIDKVQAMNIDEFVDWFVDEAEDEFWDKWFTGMYCQNCEPVCQYNPERGHEVEYSWCELNGKCRYFPWLNNVINHKQIIKMWLELEVEDD